MSKVEIFEGDIVFFSPTGKENDISHCSVFNNFWDLYKDLDLFNESFSEGKIFKFPITFLNKDDYLLFKSLLSLIQGDD